MTMHVITWLKHVQIKNGGAQTLITGSVAARKESRISFLNIRPFTSTLLQRSSVLLYGYILWK